MGILEHAVSVAATQDLDAEACAPSLAEDGHEAPAASDCLMAAPLVSPSGAGTEVSRGAQDSCDKKAVSFSGAAEAAEVVGVQEARRGGGQDAGQLPARSAWGASSLGTVTTLDGGLRTRWSMRAATCWWET